MAHPIVFRGAIFADNARFDRCIELWLHALKLRQLNHITVVTDLLRFAQVFSQIIHVGVELDFSQVISVLDASVTELGKSKTKIKNQDFKDDIEQYIVSSTKNALRATFMTHCFVVWHIETYFYIFRNNVCIGRNGLKYYNDFVYLNDFDKAYEI